MSDYDDGFRDGYGLAERDAAAELAAVRKELARVRNAGNQALRQWKMYADMDDSNFEQSAEGAVYRACAALLTDEEGPGK